MTCVGISGWTILGFKPNNRSTDLDDKSKFLCVYIRTTHTESHECVHVFHGRYIWVAAADYVTVSWYWRNQQQRLLACEEGVFG